MSSLRIVCPLCNLTNKQQQSKQQITWRYEKPERERKWSCWQSLTRSVVLISWQRHKCCISSKRKRKPQQSLTLIPIISSYLIQLEANRKAKSSRNRFDGCIAQQYDQSELAHNGFVCCHCCLVATSAALIVNTDRVCLLTSLLGANWCFGNLHKTDPIELRTISYSRVAMSRNAVAHNWLVNCTNCTCTSCIQTGANLCLCARALATQPTRLAVGSHKKLDVATWWLSETNI